MSTDFRRGSEWRRWDLHLHTPDTALNDQFGGWDEYLSLLRSNHSIVALGVTDYLSTANYARLLEEHKAQPLGRVQLIIPNIEFRISPETNKGGAINFHLLIDPSDERHIEFIDSALHRLSFNYNDQLFSCTRADIAKLGKAFDPSLSAEDKQYESGINQYKIEFATFCRWLDGEKWLKTNSLIAVSGGGHDGPSGLTGGWAAVKEELWRYTHLIFSGNPNARRFWLLEDSLGGEQAKKLGGPKPCIHGSDAHKLADVFEPAEKRYCWIKADPTFEGLRQILYEPAGRVYIGPTAPSQHDCSQVISSIRISGGALAPLGEFTLPINDGLVAIIGPKGAGKSALADLVSYTAGSGSADKRSFLHRAGDHLKGVKVDLLWADGSSTVAQVGQEQPKRATVRYLSQSFVEQLCSDDYRGGALTDEIEHVIFRNLDPTDTLNASSFRELRSMRTNDTERERVDLSARIKTIISENEKLRVMLKEVPAKKAKVEALGKENEALTKQLPTASNDAEKKAQEDLTGLRKQLLALQGNIANQKQLLLRMEELSSQVVRFTESFTAFRASFIAEAAALGVMEGVDVTLNVLGEALLSARRKELQEAILHQEKMVPNLVTVNIEGTLKEIAKVEASVAADQVVRVKIQQNQKKVSLNDQEIQRLQREITRTESETTSKIRKGGEDRLDAYEGLFRSWSKEQMILESLYDPVQKRLASGQQEERRLDFYMKWEIDIDGWVDRGNNFFDSRKAHPFGSTGDFRAYVESTLLPAWTAGEPHNVRAAMDSFLSEVRKRKAESFLKSSVNHANFLEWVFSYSHIQLTYGLRYNQTELEKLSPGTRGIVLLMLYLAMDTEDTRPLIVDQPEENLDSDSVYSLLSKYFRNAKVRRQVIVVTHNPNLVVNTDADQIVVAQANRQNGSFPTFTYLAGSLENSSVIRSKVCNLLEGGPNAFREREKRYALQRSIDNK